MCDTSLPKPPQRKGWGSGRVAVTEATPSGAVLELAPSNQPAWVTPLFVHLILGTDNITAVKELRFGEQEPDFL